MGQELLDYQGYVRKPRKYFVATNSNGDKLVRGSADRDYSYCVILKTHSEMCFVWGSWSATEHNAKRYCKTWNNQNNGELYEVVKAELVSAKEARAIKKKSLEIYRLRKEALEKEYGMEAMLKGKNLQQETENDNDNTN